MFYLCNHDQVECIVVCVFVFFFKQKTAYEIQYGLVGSEMCIRDSGNAWLVNNIKVVSSPDEEIASIEQIDPLQTAAVLDAEFPGYIAAGTSYTCLLYTSDAADERSSVDLGGRRIIKKKKNEHKSGHRDVTK